jgi:hypothetical protein
MYKVINNYFGTFIVRTDENSVTTFATEQSNTDYQEYLKWVAEGNEPIPADE